MDQLIKDSLLFLKSNAEQTTSLTIWELIFALSSSLFCSIFIGWVYRATHRGVGYSQSYVHSLVLTSLVTTVIMIVIGSNIARAFSLVGALSIIRFRNAIKETRDVGFIFFAMSVAMANGTRFHGVAIVATVYISGAMLFLFFTNYAGNRQNRERLLRVQLPPGLDPSVALDETLSDLFESFSIVLVESIRQGMLTEVLYSVRPKSNLAPTQVIDEISKVNSNLKVSYNYGMHTDDV